MPLLLQQEEHARPEVSPGNARLCDVLDCKKRLIRQNLLNGRVAQVRDGQASPHAKTRVLELTRHGVWMMVDIWNQAARSDCPGRSRDLLAAHHGPDTVHRVR